jgi:exosortase/archaeosortase family protein
MVPELDGTPVGGGEAVVGRPEQGRPTPRRWRWLTGGDEPRGLIVRGVIVAALVVIAYQYSLGTLLSSLGEETPLSYLGLVPLISLLLIAGLIYLPGRPQRDIHDRYLDYIVGLPLLAIALLVVTLGPARMSTFFWLWRLDLLSLPLFVAGAIAIVFGVRMLWRLRLPVVFLLLAWPPPYTLWLNGLLDDVTNLTLSALHALVGLLPLAVPLGYGDGSLFQLSHGGSTFVLSVASACSGVNSVLGFLLVGAAAAALVRGPRPLKLLWLIAGMALIWSLDVVRIVVIFVAADLWGENFSIDVLHPVVGLLFFSLGVLGMILLMPRFRLQLLGPATVTPSTAEPQPAVRPTRPRIRPQPAVRRAGVPLLVLAVAAAGVAVADFGLGQYQLLAQDLGPPRVQPVTLVDAAVPGWALRFVATYDFDKVEFGTNSTWDRYIYLPGSASTVPQTVPITLDVISTSDLGSFSTYTVADCYHFHGYTETDQATADLGGGVVASTVVYEVQGGLWWAAVYWEWPVTTASGETYQRIVLNELATVNPTGSEAALVSFARSVVSATGQESAVPSSA